MHPKAGTCLCNSTLSFRFGEGEEGGAQLTPICALEWHPPPHFNQAQIVKISPAPPQQPVGLLPHQHHPQSDLPLLVPNYWSHHEPLLSPSLPSAPLPLSIGYTQSSSRSWIPVLSPWPPFRPRWGHMCLMGSPCLQELPVCGVMATTHTKTYTMTQKVVLVSGRHSAHLPKDA